MPTPSQRPRARGPALAATVAVACPLAACGGREPVTPAIPPPTVTAPAAAGAEPGATRTAGAEAPPHETAPAETRARPRGALTVHVRRSTALRTRPGGPIVARLGTRTEFGSPTVLPVLRRSSGWLAVLSTRLPNGRVGWISARASVRRYRNPYRIVVSLRRREVLVRRADRTVQRFPVAIGGPSTPTPRGRFAVTDKLLTRGPSSPYGCCILALSGHQRQTPQGWGGGDRLAIHGTNLPDTIGTAASLGCLRAPTAAIRRAVRTVPLGTVVRIGA